MPIEDIISIDYKYIDYKLVKKSKKFELTQLGVLYGLYVYMMLQAHKTGKELPLYLSMDVEAEDVPDGLFKKEGEHFVVTKLEFVWILLYFSRHRFNRNLYRRARKTKEFVTPMKLRGVK